MTSKRMNKTIVRRLVRRTVNATDYHIYGNRRQYRARYGAGITPGDFRWATRDMKQEWDDEIRGAIEG